MLLTLRTRRPGAERLVLPEAFGHGRAVEPTVDEQRTPVVATAPNLVGMKFEDRVDTQLVEGQDPAFGSGERVATVRDQSPDAALGSEVFDQAEYR